MLTKHLHVPQTDVAAKLARVMDLVRTIAKGGETAAETELKARALRSEQRLTGEIDRVVGLLDDVKHIASIRQQELQGLHRDLQGARERFLSLIQDCLTNVIYEDAPLVASGAHVFDKGLREHGWDWPSVAHSMIGTKRMGNLRRECERVLAQGVPGDFIETGVWRGGACIMMRAVLRAYGVSDRNVWVADSFSGLPPPDEKYIEDKDSTFHTFPELSVSIEQVKSNFEKYGLLDEQVKFLKGYFNETLPDSPISQLAVLRLDGDMYQSTMDALDALYHKLSPGGSLIVDDYCVVEACRTAVHDFRSTHGIEEPMIEIDGVGIYWIKT